MPELPEVHTIVTDLNNEITGLTIKDILIERSYSTIPTNEIFYQEVKGKEILGVSRIAKNIILELSDEKFIAIHLAMTGRVLIAQKQDETHQWTKVILLIAKSTSVKANKLLKFCDMRMFGKVALLERDDLNKMRERYGIDINLADPNNAEHAETFYKSIKSKKTNIKNALLDQEVVSGLGNIYATDTLFLSGIHPLTPTTNITHASSDKLFRAAKEVISEGIQNRGSTLPDLMYVDIFGKPGNQQKHFKVYMQNKCKKCQGKIETLKINGRGTYFCPACQRLKA